MVAILNTNTITFVPLIIAFKAMSISNTLVMTDFAIVNASFAVDSTNIRVDHANNGVNDDDIAIVNANNVTDHTVDALGDTYILCRQPKKPVKTTSPTPM